MVLATVRGDVHDIGKNLVDIILTNNGYRVVNLGIKQPIGAILEAAVDAQGRRRRHVGAAGQIDRGHAREPRRDEPAGARRAGHARRRRADPALCRGGLRQGLCRGPRRLCPRRLRRARADGQDRHRQVRRPSRRGPRQERGPRGQAVAQARPRRRPAADAAGRSRRDPPAPRRADPQRAGAAAALLGAARDHPGVAEGGRALPQRAHALPIPVGLPEGRQVTRRVPRMGQGRAAPGIDAHPRHRDPRGDPDAAGRLRLLALRRRGQRRDPVRRWTAAAS